jgi:baseplate J-like protein
MAHRLPDDINALLQLFDQQDGHQRIEALPVEDGESWESEAEGAITETIHVYFVRESELGDPTDEHVVESTLAASDDPLQRAAFADEPQQAHTPADPEMVAHRPVLGTRTRASLARWTVGVGIVLLLTSIALQMVLLLLKPTATITLVPVVRDLSITTNMMAIESGTPTGEQIPARRLTPLTLTQTKTAPATGKGHQDAEAAMGTITFYNGLFTSQTIAAGTTLTGSDGVQVITDQLAVIPAALATTPPTYGQVTVSAHALEPGPRGNIPVRDINQVCCLPSVLVQTTAAFQGGQNERDYTVVTWEDINQVVANLIPTLKQSEHAAFAAQLRAHEALATPPCTRSVTPDHQAGAEAARVTVTVSEQCTAIAYDGAALREQAIQVLTRELVQRGGPHYRLVSAVQASVLHARIIDQRREVAYLTVQIEGTSMYQFSQQQLQRIKQLIAGKTPPQAVRILLALPGVQRASVAGIGESRSLPKDSSCIQVRILYGEGLSVIVKRQLART